MKLVLTGLAIGILILGIAGGANAAIITDLYGDIDGFGSGVTDGSNFHPSMVFTESDDEGITDRGLYSDQSWTHTYDISGFGPINSASIDIFIGGLGAYSGSASLFIDTTYVGLLTDGDTCGSGLCSNTAHLDTYSLDPYLGLLDGATSFTVDAIYSGDYWALDYSLLTIDAGDVAPVPEPATLFLIGTGLAGLAGTRLRKKKR